MSKKHIFIVSSFLLLFVTGAFAQQTPDEFEVGYQITDVTCNGDANGSINIESFTCSIDDGNGNSSGGCFDGPIPNTHSCTDPVDATLPLSGYHGLTAGTIYKAPDGFNGGIDFYGGATLYICGVADFGYLNVSHASKIIVFGELRANSISINHVDAEIYNYGKIVVQNTINSAGTIYNYGDVYCKAQVNMNANSEFYNYDDLIVGNSEEFGGVPDWNGSLHVNSSNTLFENHGVVKTYQNLVVNSSSAAFVNYCTVDVMNNADINSGSPFHNYGVINIGGRSIWNTSTIVLHEGSYYGTDKLDANSVGIDNPDATCSKLEVQTVQNFNNNTFSGAMSVCLPSSYTSTNITFQNGAAEDCACQVSTTGTSGGGGVSTNQDPLVFDVVWGNGSTSRTIGGLSGGTQEVTITNELCTQTVQFQIHEPHELTFSVESINPSCAGQVDGAITILAHGGTAPYEFQFTTAEGWQADNMKSDLDAGTFELNVRDNNGCQAVAQTVELEEGDTTFLDLEVIHASCYEGEDSAFIIIDGITDTTTNGGNNGNQLDPKYSCSPNTDPIPFSCTDGNVSVTSPWNHTIGAGNTTVISSDYNGWVNIDGGTLIICGVVHMTDISLNNPNDRLVVLGELYVNGINMNNKQSQVFNYGMIDYRGTYVSIGGNYFNYGELKNIAGLNINTDARLETTGSITVQNDININDTVVNYGTLSGGRDLNMGTGGSLTNSCTVTIDGEMRVNTGAPVTNYNYIFAHSLLLNSHANITMDNGLVEVNRFHGTDNVLIEDVGPYCSKVKIHDHLFVSNDVGVLGNVDVCIDPTATTENPDRINYLSTDAEESCACMRTMSGSGNGNNNNTGSGLDLSWSNGATGDTIFVTTGGTYSVVTTIDGCIHYGEVEVTFPDPPNVSVNVTNLSCEQALNDGVIQAVYTNGEVQSSTLYIQNENGEFEVYGQGKKWTDLFAGTYFVAFDDGSGCLYRDTVEVLTSTDKCFISDLEFTINTVVEPDSCGIYKVVVFDESPWPVRQYNWTLPDLTETNSNINELILQQSGSYELVLVVESPDGIMYSVPQTIELTIPGALDFTYAVTDADGNAADGLINVTSVSNSFGDVSYVGPGNTTNSPIFDGLAAGTYQVTVEDDFCSITKDIEVDNNGGPNCAQGAYTLEVTNIRCYGEDNGAAEVHLTGASTGVVVAEWLKEDNGLYAAITTEDVAGILGLSPGNYQAVVKIMSGETVLCTYTPAPFQVTTPAAITHQSFPLQDPSYLDAIDGSAYVSFTGGTNPELNWVDDENATNQIIRNGLGVGTYFYIIEDDNGCTEDGEVTLEAQCEHVVADAHLCDNNCPVEITISSSCLVDSEDPTCPFDDPECSLVGVNIAHEPFQCEADPGTLTVSLTGQAGLSSIPVLQSVSWVNGANCSPLGNENPLMPAHPGFYEALVEVAIGDISCRFIEEYIIPGPGLANELAWTFQDIPCPGKDGEINVLVPEALTPLTFVWTAPSGDVSPETSENIIVTGAGDYIFSASHPEGCEYIDTVTISQTNEVCNDCDVLGLEIGKFNVTCHGADNGRITLEHDEAFKIVSLEWTGPNGYSSSDQYLFHLEPGAYHLIATFEHLVNGTQCSTDESYEITEPAIISIDFSELDLCTQNVEDLISGGVGGYQVAWDLVSPGEELPNKCFAPGIYQLHVFDGNGCSTQQEITVVYSESCAEGESLCFNASGLNFSCDNSAGQIVVSDLDGAPSYDLIISGQSGYSHTATITSDYTLTPVQPGSYSVTISAIVGGLFQSYSQTIEVPHYLAPDYSIASEEFPDEPCRQLTQATTVSANSSHEFAWVDVTTGDTLSTAQTAVLENGSYQLIVTDPLNPACPQVEAFEVTGLDVCGNQTTEFNLDVSLSGCFNSLPQRTFEVTQAATSIDRVEWIFNGINLSTIDPYAGSTNIVSEDTKTLITTASDGLMIARVFYYDNFVLKSVDLEHVVLPNANYFLEITRQGVLNCDGTSQVDLEVVSSFSSSLLKFDWYAQDEASDPLQNLSSYSESYAVTEGGIYTVIVDLPTGCPDTLVKEVPSIVGECNCENLPYDLDVTALGCQPGGGELKFSIDEQLYTVNAIEWSLNDAVVSTDADYTGISDAGSYELAAEIGTQDGTCDVDVTVLLAEHGPLQVTNINGVAPSCIGNNDGRIELTVNGGSGRYHFENSAGDVIDITLLEANTYNLVVVDEDGCDLAFQATVPASEIGSCFDYIVGVGGNNRICYSDGTSRQDQMTNFGLSSFINPAYVVVDRWEWYDEDGTLIKTALTEEDNILGYTDLLNSPLFTLNGPLFMRLYARAVFADGTYAEEDVTIGSTSISFDPLELDDLVLNNPTGGNSGFIQIDATEEEFENYVYTIEYLDEDFCNATVNGTLFSGAPGGTYLITKTDGFCVSTLEVELGGSILSSTITCDDAITINSAAAVITNTYTDAPETGAVTNIGVQGSNITSGAYSYDWGGSGDYEALSSSPLSFAHLDGGEYFLNIVHESKPECGASACFEVEELIRITTDPTDSLLPDGTICGMTLNVYDYVDFDTDVWSPFLGDNTGLTEEQIFDAWVNYYETNNVCRFYSAFDEEAGTYTVLDADPSNDATNYGEQITLIPGEYDLVIGCNDDLDETTPAYEMAELPEDVWVEFIDEEGGLNLFPGRQACGSEESFLSNDYWGNADKAGQVTWYSINSQSPSWQSEQFHFDDFRAGVVSASEASLVSAGWVPLTGDMWTNNTPQVSPQFTTVYGAVDNDNGCIHYRAAVIQVLGGLTTTTITKEMCPGEMINLDPSESISGTNYNFVEWTDNPEANEVRMVSPTSYLTVYEAILDDRTGLDGPFDAEEPGCPLVATFEVTLLGSPIVAEDQVLQVCRETEVVLTAGLGTTYSWMPAAGLPVTNENTITVTAEESMTYMVEIGNAADCKVDQSFELNVHDSFNPTAEIAEVCLGGGQLQLEASEGTLFNWTPEPVSGQGTGIAVFDLSDGRDLIVAADVENEFGCEATIEREIAAPGVLSLISSDGKVCLGKPVQLFASSDVTWSPDFGISNNASSNPFVYLSADQTFTASGVDAYGCPFEEEITIEVDANCDCYEVSDNPLEETFFWRSGAGYAGSDPLVFDANWDNLANWSVDKDVYEVPLSLPDFNDNVVVEDLSAFGTSFDIATMSHAVELNNLCVLGHELEMSGFDITYKGNGVFSGGEVLPSVGTIVGDGTEKEGENLGYFSGTKFGVPVTINSAEQLYLNGSEFGSTSFFQFTGDQELHYNGGNTFKGATRFQHNGLGNVHFAFNPDGSGDVFEDEIIFENLNTGLTYPSASHTDQYKGNIYLAVDGLQFGTNGGTVSICGETQQYIEGALGVPVALEMGHLQMAKTGLSQVNTLVLNNAQITIVKTRPGFNFLGSLELQNGFIESNWQNGMLSAEYDVTIGTGGLSSYVGGPLKLFGDGDRTYPIGQEGRFMPVTLKSILTGVEGNALSFSTQDPRRADDFDETVSSVSVDDDLQFINDCEFWRFAGTSPFDASIVAVLPWDEQSCDIPNDLSNLRAAVLENESGAGTWKDGGNVATIGSPASVGTVESEALGALPLVAGASISGFAMGATSDPGFETPTGFSFNNYGGKVTVNGAANLIVYGDILNENGIDETPGTFVNEGAVKVEDDWTNNALAVAPGETDEIFVFESLSSCPTCVGDVNMFGNDQRIRGEVKTRFHRLHLDGNGEKAMYVDAEVDDVAEASLNLTDNELNTTAFTMHVLNSDAGTVIRTNTGFVSSDHEFDETTSTISGGLLKWNMASGAGEYKFPIGTDNMYRPFSLNYTDPEGEAAVFAARLNEEDPAEHELPHGPENRSPMIERVNDEFYYHIEKTDATVLQDGVDMKFFFDRPTDGYFQSLAHWTGSNPLHQVGGVDLTPFNGTDRFGYSYVAGDKLWVVADGDYSGDFDNTPSSAMNNEPTDILMVNGHAIFDEPYYSLSRSGLVLQTSSFGDPDGDNGQVVYQVTGDGITSGNGGSVFQTENSSASGTTAQDQLNHGDLLVPDVWNSVVEISVQENSNTVGGTIRVETTPNGQIVQDVEGNYAITYLDCSVQQDPCEEKVLNPALYNVKDGAILELLSEKPYEGCMDHWTVNWNLHLGDGPFVNMEVTTDGDPNALPLANISSVYVCPVTDETCTTSFPMTETSTGIYQFGGSAPTQEGVYNLHIEVTNGGASETIKAQVIYK